MTRPIACLPVFLLVCLFGCAKHPSSPVAVPSAIQSAHSISGVPAGVRLTPLFAIPPGSSIDNLLSQPFDAAYHVTLSAPDQGVSRTLGNCREYLPVETEIGSAGSALDLQGLRMDGARCDALNLLRSARAAARPSFAGFTMGQLSARDLPVGLALVISNEEQARADVLTRSHASILSFEPAATLTAVSSDQATLATRNWTAQLLVYARADFLGDGSEQLLVRRDAAVRRGTYASTRLFVLARDPASRVLTIVRQLP